MEETAQQHHDDDSLGGLRNTKTQSRRPVDAAIRQQRMKSWKPILDPVYVIIGFFALGAVFVGTGNVWASCCIRNDGLIAHSRKQAHSLHELIFLYIRKLFRETKFEIGRYSIRL
jgi:hypothetical protein